MKTLLEPRKLIFPLIWLLALPLLVRPAAAQTGGFVLVKEKAQLPQWSGSLPVECAFAKGTATISANNGRLSFDWSITYNSIDAKKGSETIHVEWQVDQPPDFLPLGQKLRITCRGTATAPGGWNERSETFFVKANVVVQTPGWQYKERELINGVWAGNPADMEESVGLIDQYRGGWDTKFIGSGTMYTEGTLAPAHPYKPGQELRIAFYFNEQPGGPVKWTDEAYKNCPMHGDPLAVYYYRYEGEAAGGGGEEAETDTKKPPTEPGEKTKNKWAPCDRYEEALAKVNFMQLHLQTLRQMRTELEDARLAILETMCASDIIDVGFVAGGVWAGSVSGWFAWSTKAAKEAAKQAMMIKVMNSILKAVVKEGLKQLVSVMESNKVDMAQILSSAGESGGKKFLSEVLKNDMAAEGQARILGWGLKGAMPNGQLRPTLRQAMQSEYVTPAVDAVFYLVDVVKTVGTYESQVDQCEALREAIRNFENNVLNPRELKLQIARDDMYVAKAACDQWRIDNPEKEVRR